MRLLFFGSGEFGLPTLEALHERHDLAAVVTQPDRPAGRKRRLTPTPVARWADEHGVTAIKAENVNDQAMVERVAALKPDASIVIAFGQKLSPPLIEAMGRLAVNLHGSLLPRYRGAAPINWAMIRNERVTGVSVIGLAQRMDAGEVYATAETPIDPNETAGELHDRVAQLGPGVVLRTLDDLHAGRLQPIPQDDAEATRAPKLSKADGTVDFAQPAALVRARVHGLTPWPGCRVRWWRGGRTDVEPSVLTLRRVRDRPDEEHREAPGAVLDGFRVACERGSIELREVQAPGTKVMSIDAFVAGHRLRVGDRLAPMEADAS